MAAMRSPAETDEGAFMTAPMRSLAVRPCRCGNPPEPRPPKCRCVGIDHTPIDRPDLAIFSQDEQIANGALPSWDSPDIITNDWGPFRLRLEADVTIRNLSRTTAAANARVHFYTSPFGIGTRRQLRLTRVVNLGPGHQTTVVFPLSQEMLGGDPRVGVHVVIEHPTDGRLINNAGSQVHDGGYTTESGRLFTVGIPVLNDSGVGRQLHLSVLPTDVVATVTPSVHAFAPFEQIVATLRVEVPAFLVGTPTNEIPRAVTVVAREAGGAIVGGATRLLRINS